jgi:hypothetical protein
MVPDTMTSKLAKKLIAILRGCFMAVSPMNWKAKRTKIKGKSCKKIE